MEKPPLVFKVAVVGNGSVGKTTLLRRYCTGQFQESRIMTIGVDFQTIIISVDGQPVKLTVWDIAGQERFAYLRDSFYKGAKTVALAYDVSQPVSFQDLPRWRDEVCKMVPGVLFVVTGTKADLPRTIPREEAEAFANSLGAPYFETSALSGEGVEAFFHGFAQRTLEAVSLKQRPPSDEQASTLPKVVSPARSNLQ